jgi:hypothetical protein
MIPIDEMMNFSSTQFQDAFKFSENLKKDLKQLICASNDEDKIELAKKVQNSIKNLKNLKSTYKSLRQIFKMIDQIDRKWDLVMKSNNGIGCISKLANETLIEFKGGDDIDNR